METYKLAFGQPPGLGHVLKKWPGPGHGGVERRALAEWRPVCLHMSGRRPREGRDGLHGSKVASERDVCNGGSVCQVSAWGGR